MQIRTETPSYYGREMSARLIFNLTVPLACRYVYNLNKIVYSKTRKRKYLVHRNRAGTSINRLLRTVQTFPVSQLVHRDGYNNNYSIFIERLPEAYYNNNQNLYRTITGISSELCNCLAKDPGKRIK